MNDSQLAALDAQIIAELEAKNDILQNRIAKLDFNKTFLRSALELIKRHVASDSEFDLIKSNVITVCNAALEMDK